MSKRQEIKQASIQLFTDKGYHLSSVQEIASMCAISKGAFYKHFDSKEDLLVELLRDNQDNMLHAAYSVSLPNAGGNIELFRKRVAVELEQTHLNRSFLLVIFNEFPPSQDNQISIMIEKFRIRLIDWHRQCLIDAFGDEIAPIVWDLIVIFEGIMKEYLSLIVFHNIHISLPKVARLIVASIDTLVQSSQMIDPILSEDDFYEKDNMKIVSTHDTIENLILRMVDTIDTLQLSSENKEKIHASLMMLRKECKKEVPKMYLIEALTLYMKSLPALQSQIQQLEQMITNWYGGEK